MGLLRDARRIRGRYEVTLSGARVAVLSVAVVLVVAAAFATGYLVAERRAPVVITAPAAFPFTDPLAILDQPRPLRAPAPYAPPPAPPASSSLDDVRVLEERVRVLAQRGVEVAPAAVAAAAPSTDAELRGAIEPDAPKGRAVVELSSGGRRADAADRSARPAARVTASAERPASGSPAAPSEPLMESPPAPKAPAAPKTEPKAPPKAEPRTAPASEPKATPSGASSPAERARKVAARAASSRFTLQVRAYPDRDKDKAEELVEHLKQRGFEAYLASAEVNGKGTWYRVRVGKFQSRDTAERFREKLQSEEKTPAFVTALR